MKKAILIILTLVAFLVPSFAGLQEMIQETQKMDMANNKMVMIWWIPSEYWAESLKSNPGVTKEQIEEFTKAVKPYTLIAVIDSEIGLFGGVTPKSKKDITENISIEIDQKVLKPLAVDDLTPDIQNFISMMKPMMSQMLGQFGSGMEFIVFAGQDESEKKIIDIGKEGFLFINYHKTYGFRLPLGSMMAPMKDPKTSEEFPGNYRFNPFTGTKLKKI